MSSSTSDSEEEIEYFCKNDPQFSDLDPIEQDDGPNPVVQILYTDSFKDNYDYFRAIYRAQEISKRAYFLTEKCIDQNPSNYTVWEYRRRIVKELKLDCMLELEFTKSKMGSNPKKVPLFCNTFFTHFYTNKLKILKKNQRLSKQ